MLDALGTVFVLFAPFALPLCLGFVVADCSRRRVIRIPAAVTAFVRALYVALLAAPLAFVVLFALLVLRARLTAGHPPVLGHVDAGHLFDWIPTSPHPLDMPIHAWTVLVLLIASQAGLLLLPGIWAILRVERGESLSKVVRVFLPGSVLVWAVILSLPFYFNEWFLASMLG